jgi:hypothetical protein
MNEVQHMRHNTLFMVIASLVLIAGLAAAGCTQAGSTGTSASAGTDVQGSADGNGNVAAGPASSGGQNGGLAGNYPGQGTGRDNRGQGGFFNETRINAAAAKLGISADTLSASLNSSVNSTNGRPDMNAAAGKLGVTQQQLADALGFTGGVGTPYNGTRTRGSMNRSAGQGPGGQPPA